MISVVVVGAGGIGSRHLQALRLLSTPTSIEILDLAPARSHAALASALAVPAAAEQQMRVRETKEELSGSFDVAILATTAGTRLEALKDLLVHASVDHVIFEKFLFGLDESYETARALLQATDTRGWVNTPRRLWPSYRGLKKRFASDAGVTCRVTTSPRLAIGTSAIHFLDALAFVTGRHTFELSGSRLHLDERPGRRPGYTDFVGTLTGHSDDGDEFEYVAHPRGTAPILVELSSSSRRYLISEAQSRACYAGEDTAWAWQSVDFESVYQSRLTQLVVEDLLRTGTCGLPTYHESGVLHRQMLSAFLDGYRRVTGQDVDACPIT